LKEYFFTKFVLYHVFVFIFVGSILACSTKNKTEVGFIEVKDDLGRVIKVKSNPDRVMALSSSLSEMLYLICPDSEIIARTQNCNYPPAILSKPVINNYPIDYEGLLVLHPDIVFAKDGIMSLEDAEKIQSMGIPVFFQKYTNIEDIFAGLEELGEVLNKKEKAHRVADSLRNEANRMNDELQGKNGKKPKVLILITLDQLFVFGKDSYVSDIIEKAGGMNAMSKIFNNPFPQINTEYILQINPDLIFILGEKPLNLTTMYPELEKVEAVKKNAIFRIEGDLVSRPGPRVVEAIKIIRQKIVEYER